MYPHTAPSCPFDVVSAPLGPSFCSFLVIWLDIFCSFLTCLWGLCRALPCQLGILSPALHFSASLSTCQDYLFKKHPTLRTSSFSSDTFFFSFFSSPLPMPCTCWNLLSQNWLFFPHQLLSFSLGKKCYTLKKKKQKNIIMTFTEGVVFLVLQWFYHY